VQLHGGHVELTEREKREREGGATETERESLPRQDCMYAAAEPLHTQNIHKHVGREGGREGEREGGGEGGDGGGGGGWVRERERERVCVCV
jgi:hypothetical protein